MRQGCVEEEGGRVWEMRCMVGSTCARPLSPCGFLFFFFSIMPGILCTLDTIFFCLILFIYLAILLLLEHII